MALMACAALAAMPRAVAASPVLQIDANGILTGASGVDVAGTLYDLQFIDSSCAAIWSGCDSVSDLDFQTQTDALAAAQALLDQVVGNGNPYDMQPELISGCQGTGFAGCTIWIPYNVVLMNQTDFVITTAAAIDNPGLFNSLGGGGGLNTSDLGGLPIATFARFTPAAPVPEPTSLLLLATGALGVVATEARRRRNQR